MEQYRIPPLFREPIWLLAIAAIALALGMYARFKGLGFWPLGIDEYYTASSIRNVLQLGVPEFACGGWYTRGLLIQYLAAGLQLLGFSPELAPRTVAAVSTLIALPAVYWLGCRMKSRTVGILAVIVLSLSVWEVEMGRFARMYAPFQAVFSWYMVFFVRYVVDREIKSLWIMLLLSIVGVLTWEGGALLAAANLLPIFLRNIETSPNEARDRLTLKKVTFLVGMLGLAYPMYWFATNKLRFSGEYSPVPKNYQYSDYWPQDSGSFMLFDEINYSLVLIAALIAWLVLAGVALRWVWQFRDRHLTACGLLLSLIAVALGHFLLFVSIIVLMLLCGFARGREIFDRSAWSFWLTAVCGAAVWFGFYTFVIDLESPKSSQLLTGHLNTLYSLFSFPDLILEVALPWGRALPFLSLVILATLAVTTFVEISRKAAQLSVTRVILIVAVCLMLIAGASNPPRHETRYLFFLYPSFILLAFTLISNGLEWGMSRLNTQQHRIFLVLACMSVFLVSEDFRPGHLLRVDSEKVHFRTGLKPRQAAHLYPRSDPRAAATWLAERRSAEDLVISSYQSFEFYYPNTDFFFVDWTDRRFGGWSCLEGKIERWSNTPLLYTQDALEDKFNSAQRVYFVSDASVLKKNFSALQKWNPQIVWKKYNIAIVSLAKTSQL
jgi:hypothetical protein